MLRRLSTHVAGPSLALLLAGSSVHAQAPAVAQATTVPTAPDDPTLAKVYGVLDKHCARCHQRGRTGDKAPSGGLTDVLDLETLSKSHQVRPGLPDASPLLIAVQTRMPPHHFKAEGEPSTSDLTSLDLTVLRAWVLALKPLPSAPAASVATPAGAVPAPAAPQPASNEPFVPPIVVVAPPDDPADDKPSDAETEPSVATARSPATVPSSAAPPSPTPSVTPPIAPSRPVSPQPPGTALTLKLETATSSFARNAEFVVRVTPSAACHLTIIGVDPRDRATVLFPSDFEPNNRIEPGKPLQLPGLNAGYRFVLSQPGHQRIVALCSTTQKTPPGIKHDFERLRFTELGDYESFVARAWDAAIYGTDPADPAADAARRNRRERQDRTVTPPPPAPVGSETRTAIKVLVQ